MYYTVRGSSVYITFKECVILLRSMTFKGPGDGNIQCVHVNADEVNPIHETVRTFYIFCYLWDVVKMNGILALLVTRCLWRKQVHVGEQSLSLSLSCLCLLSVLRYCDA